MRVYVHAFKFEHTKDSKKNVVTYVEAIKISEASLSTTSKAIPKEVYEKNEINFFNL